MDFDFHLNEQCNTLLKVYMCMCMYMFMYPCVWHAEIISYPYLLFRFRLFPNVMIEISSRHSFIGKSSKNGMVMSGTQSLRTFFIAFTMCATKLVPL